MADVLALADSIGLLNLKSFLLEGIHQSFGAIRRRAVGLPPPPPLSSLSGFERLPDALREEVEWAAYGTSGGSPLQ